MQHAWDDQAFSRSCLKKAANLIKSASPSMRTSLTATLKGAGSSTTSVIASS
jgi:hypothetical protein